jgi:hypothetical protein
VKECDKVQQIRDFAPFERPWGQNYDCKKIGGSWSREAMFKYSLNAHLRKPNTLPTCRYARPILRNSPLLYIHDAKVPHPFILRIQTLFEQSSILIYLAYTLDLEPHS